MLFKLKSFSRALLISLFGLTTLSQAFTLNGSAEGNFANASFRHWNAGNEYSYLVGLKTNLTFTYSKKPWLFEATQTGKFELFESHLALPRKEEDRLELMLLFSRDLNDQFTLNTFADLKTQWFPGYDYYSDEPENYENNFFAPAFIVQGISGKFTLTNPSLAIIATPFALKTTLVLDRGVDPEAFGVSENHNHRFESGAYANLTASIKIIKRTTLDFKTSFFTAYGRNATIDIDAQSEINIKLFSFLTLYSSVRYIHDKDVLVKLYEDLDADGGFDDFTGVSTRPQILGQLGIKLHTNFSLPNK